MGFEVAAPFIAYAAPRVSAAERAAFLDAYERRVLDAAAVPVVRDADAAARALDDVGAAAWGRQV